MKSIIEIFIAALGATLAVSLSEHFGTVEYIVVPFDIILAIALSVLIITILRYIIIEMPLLFYTTRKLIDPRAYMEGLYYEIFDKRAENRVSISCVRYLWRSKKFQYFGNNYKGDDSNAPTDTWQSSEVFIDLETKTLTYFFTTEYLGTEERRTTTGYGSLKFLTGNGQYFDLSDVTLKRHDHLIKKLDSDKLEKYLGNRKTPKQEDWPLLAKKINCELTPSR